ncbi:MULTISPECIES: SCP2 sterol-binding domain-containing protein [Micromonospora]|uniref:SCP2 sterol-binding domain-containing protein n=1 Tax=Micromonospora zamorensis TaxID=709883 RepID=A0ABZ1PDE9_9ACTN|nr:MULTISPECIES: SCP2 sterol-binding domain-containing protein [Micromonospora]MBQ0979378.1 SCP2 sterol-binding domain-containing protein [Micromonospora sp. M61]MBQ1035535.1 SCP2 sterol-binding domain-containing protein [Micromonospora sp. C81]WTI20794.1 SCP2 sterol-binding domain-containing protein [Micromonospora zamorensis]
MTEAAERFFESLPARAPDVLGGLADGTLQIDLGSDHRTEHWLVRMRPGSVQVSRERGPADAIWFSSAALFDRLITGEAQGVAAVLRNESTFSGNVVLFLAFRRFFPDPPGTRDPREVARRAARRST